MADELVFDEAYGYLTKQQLQLYKTRNVSPADHDLLVDRFGTDSTALMVFVEQNSRNGLFAWSYPYFGGN